MADLNNFDAWLSGQKSDVCAVVALRAALRLFPLLYLEFRDNDGELAKNISNQYFLRAVRAAAYAWARVNYPTKDVTMTGASLVLNAPNYVGDRPFAQVYKALTSASSVKSAAKGVNDRFLGSAKRSLSHSKHAAMLVSNAIVADTEASLISDTKTRYNATGLLNSPLWISGKPDWVVDFLSKLSAKLISLGEDWESWVIWYEAILEGQPTPGDEKLDLFRVNLNNHEDWKLGPAHVNSLIKSNGGLDQSRTRLTLGTGSPKVLETEKPEIPDQLDGPSWEPDVQTGLLNPVFRQSNQSESEIADMEGQRAFLLECARGLITAIENSTSNSVKQLLPAAERYCRSIEISSSLISIPEVYAAGVRLRNSHDRIRREVENEGMPNVAINIGEAMDSVIGLHGPFILATARGREMNARARDDNRTKAQELAYKAKSLELSEALWQSDGLVTEGGKNLIAEINNEIATGPQPERSTMLAEASNHNLLVTTSGLAAKEYTKNVLFGTVVVQSAVGNGISVANIALNWMLANTALLLSLAATSPETLHWLPHFLNWLKVKHDLSRN